MKDLTRKAFSLRKDVLDMIYNSGGGHIGGDFSVMEILVTLYFKQMNVNPNNFSDDNHDRFILSKGHSVEALYAVLCEKGFFPKADLETLGKYNSLFIGHPNNKINGIEMNSGSLGHGLSVGVGMALAGKMDNKDYRVYVVMGDGELAEGSVWEGIMSAGHYKLDNLCVVIDRNKLQISGETETVMAQENISERFKSFGFHAIETEGNNIPALNNSFEEARTVKNKPTVIIANTIKGYGVSFMENNASWHHKVPSESEYEAAVKELAKGGVQ